VVWEEIGRQKIDEVDRENWSTGGELHIDKFGKGYGKIGAK